ncbi:hypothetical protein [Elioraea rosea]|uniref:hypothetical protein n=1 Tax=Elioraea rosea TaxID=2492390 RepID=UPI0013155EF1|nr:hypothetical protein [Elioraea rosea]
MNVTHLFIVAARASHPPQRRNPARRATAETASPSPTSFPAPNPGRRTRKGGLA